MGAPLQVRVSTAQELRLPKRVKKQPKRIENFLYENGLLTAANLLRVTTLQKRNGASAASILKAYGMVSGVTLARAYADQLGSRFVDLNYDPPSQTLLARLGATKALRMGLVPWRQRNGRIVVLCQSPDEFRQHQHELRSLFGNVEMAFSCKTQIQTSIANLEKPRLVKDAETCVAANASCRSFDFSKFKNCCFVFAALIIGLGVFAPTTLFMAVTCIAVLSLLLGTALKLAAILIQWRMRHFKESGEQPPSTIDVWPTVTILVPLFKETEIATQLVARLKRLDYPIELLDVILVLEADDKTTHNTLLQTRLPAWIRTLEVPAGSVQTKPRALNFALNFARGTLIGVYDAEDAPEPGQIKAVVKHFQTADENVACVQGVLDFYNARANWLARCFTVEYATWFRMVLPTLQKLGFPLPLGGTSLFIRRDVLERLGAWDAHNVTEDADLGIRLARAGFRTEMVSTVTFEEANNRTVPWIKQRSRWLKGFAITWAVHMRAPRELLSALGPTGFLGVQILFGVTLLQFFLAPLLWTFWLALFGLGHPLSSQLSSFSMTVLGTLFLLSEVITIVLGMMAVTGKNHRHLLPWVPSLHFYFPLGAFACYKAVFEILTKPFYWDKTAHGHCDDNRD